MSFVLTFLFAALPVVNDWENPKVNSINRLPPRSFTLPLESEKAAFTHDLEPSTPFFLSLNGQWKFRWEGNPMLCETNFHSTAFDDSRWSHISVPSCVEMLDYGAPMYVNIKYPHFNTSNPEKSKENFAKILNRRSMKGDYNPVSSYRRTFSVPETWEGRETILRFEGVGSAYYVWVNGEFVGYAEDSKLPSEFNITKFLKKGAENLLAVKVFKWCDGSFLEDQDMFRYSGIFRDVSLISMPKDHIWDFVVKTKNDGSLKVEGTDATWKLYDADFREVEVPVKNVKLWSAEKPYLYTLVLKKGSDIRMKRVGFKEQKIKGNAYTVNDKKIKFHGVNRHENSKDFGRSVTLQEMIEDVKLMKRYNIDTVRTAHYPSHRLWYDLCDKYGLYVVAEANVEAHDPGFKENSIGLFKEWNDQIVERNSRHVITYRNNPSVTMWSLGNEAGHGPCFVNAMNEVRRLDPSRPVQWELGKDISDVDSEMYWPVDLLEKRGKLGDDLSLSNSDGSHPLKSQNELLAKHTQGKCFFLMEFSHAMGNAGGNFSEYWDVFYKYDSLCGGCIWEWIDHGVSRPTGKLDKKTGLPETFISHGGDSWEYPNDGASCNDGIVRSDRKPSPFLHEVSHVMRGLKVVKDETGKLKIVNHYCFSDANEFDGVWECLADGRTVAQGAFDVPSVSPLSSVFFDFDLTKHVPENVDLSKQEVFFNFRFKTKTPTDLVPEKWVVSSNQIRVSDYVRTKFTSDGADDLVVEDHGQTVSVACGRTTAVFSKKQGTLLRLFMKGVDVLSSPNPSLPGGPKLTTFRAFVDNDWWLKFDYINSGLMILSYHAEPMEILSNGVKTVTRVTSCKSAMFIHEAIWEFSKDGSIVVKNKVTPMGTMPKQLPRLGLSFRLNQNLEAMTYYGRGPWENYIDRNTSSFIGRWDSTVAEQFERYSRPQDNGYKTDVRWVEFYQPGGRGIRFESDKPMFMQALHYEAMDMNLSRNNAFEFTRVNPIREQRDIFLNLDVRQCGLGQASCGPIPLEKYQFDPTEQLEWELRISPASKREK